MTDTKEKILDAAEGLFATQGIAATSSRTITNAARVNIAAINYHFGSREKLIQAVFERHLGPLNRARLVGLDALEAAYPKGPPLEELVGALVRPALALSRASGETVMRLMGRTHSEPRKLVIDLVREIFAEVFKRFLAAFARVLPQLSERELTWRLHFTIGAMAHTMSSGEILEMVSHGICRVDDEDATGDELVRFCCEGLRAPSISAPPQRSSRRREVKP